MSGDIGAGFDFALADGGAGSPVSVGKIREPTLPKIVRDAVNATHSTSPGRMDEVINGMGRLEPFSLTLIYEPGSAGMTMLLEKINAKTPEGYVATLADGTTWEFAALVSGIGPSIPREDLMEVEIDFTPSGQQTITAAGA
jgi:hypothetical protein